jgi:hypothetical protein
LLCGGFFQLTKLSENSWSHECLFGKTAHDHPTSEPCILTQQKSYQRIVPAPERPLVFFFFPMHALVVEKIVIEAKLQGSLPCTYPVPRHNNRPKARLHPFFELLGRCLTVVPACMQFFSAGNAFLVELQQLLSRRYRVAYPVPTLYLTLF